MKRPSFIVLLALVVGAAVFAASYQLSHRLCAGKITANDDLAWLRQEFQLGEAELARVRALHDGYLPRCAEMCRQIAAKKRDLEQVLARETNVNAAVEQKLSELGALRAQCQTEMLRHFAEVSQAMPPEQGRRYLAEMQRITLGTHEQIERSMSDSAGQAHGHH
jgi:Spy/CpxP family protein refolding chaperone